VVLCRSLGQRCKSSSPSAQFFTNGCRYQTLGPHWSATMLSLIEFAMIPIPVVFYLYGHKIREKSALIRQMREDREKLDGKRRRAAEKSRVKDDTSLAEKKMEV
jgi:hypothetical protein